MNGLQVIQMRVPKSATSKGPSGSWSKIIRSTTCVLPWKPPYLILFPFSNMSGCMFVQSFFSWKRSRFSAMLHTQTVNTFFICCPCELLCKFVCVRVCHFNDEQEGHWHRDGFWSCLKTLFGDCTTLLLVATNLLHWLVQVECVCAIWRPCVTVHVQS